MTDPDPNVIREQAVEAIRTIKDPEIPVNIFDLGLIYELEVDDEGAVEITMTLTSPNCPVADALPASVREKVGAIDGVKEVKLELTWEPPWTPEMMSEDAKMALDYMGDTPGFPPSAGPFTDISVGCSPRPHDESNRRDEG